MDGFSATGAAAGLCAGDTGATCAPRKAEKQRNMMQTLRRIGASNVILVWDDLKNNRIVQLRVLLRQRCGHFNFETVHDRWSDPRLALNKLWDRFKSDPVQAKSVSSVRYGESGQDSSTGCMLRAILYAHAKPGCNNKASWKLLHLDVGDLCPACVRNSSQIQAALAGGAAGQSGSIRRADEIHRDSSFSFRLHGNCGGGSFTRAFALRPSVGHEGGTEQQ